VRNRYLGVVGSQNSSHRTVNVLTLTYLGVGSTLAKRKFQSNALIEAWSAGPDKLSQPDDTLQIGFCATGLLALHRLKDEPGLAPVMP
jgi:hypothetical protein